MRSTYSGILSATAAFINIFKLFALIADSGGRIFDFASFARAHFFHTCVINSIRVRGKPVSKNEFISSDCLSIADVKKKKKTLG
jgi:hypothetical protein